MIVAYIDSSVIAAIVLNEPGAAAIVRRLGDVEQLVSSTLLEAELRSLAKRVGADVEEEVNALSYILPDRRLTPELRRTYQAGYTRGADAYHIATALYFFEDPTAGHFLTLDAAQRAIAAKLGFQTEWSSL